MMPPFSQDTFPKLKIMFSPKRIVVGLSIAFSKLRLKHFLEKFSFEEVDFQIHFIIELL